MYLSRIILNPRSAQARSELAHPYEMHRTLLKAFSDGAFNVARDDENATGVLFRTEERQNDNVILVLVQSQIAPKWDYLLSLKDSRGYPYLLPNSFGGDGIPNPSTTEFDLSQKIRSGQVLSFRLRANPTKRRKDNGKRVGLYSSEEQIAWLKRKAEEGGFRVFRHQITLDERIRDVIHREREQQDELKLLAVQFDGILQVKDPAALNTALQAGIGSGKGLGFGLLSLAPARG